MTEATKALMPLGHRLEATLTRLRSIAGECEDMVARIDELTPIEQAGASTLLEMRGLVADECGDTVAKIDECLARLGITPVRFIDGEARS